MQQQQQHCSMHSCPPGAAAIAVTHHHTPRRAALEEAGLWKWRVCITKYDIDHPVIWLFDPVASALCVLQGIGSCRLGRCSSAVAANTPTVHTHSAACFAGTQNFLMLLSVRPKLQYCSRCTVAVSVYIRALWHVQMACTPFGC
jgi:hypothetical protein